MSYFLMRSKAPTSEPVSLDEVLLSAHADKGIEDKFFLQKIRAGRELVETVSKRALCSQEWVINWDDNAPNIITLPRSPVIKIKNVMANGVYLSPVPKVMEGLPSRINLNSSGGGSLRIEYIAGYGKGKVPEALREAVILYTVWAYNNREAETEIPRAFYDLVNPFKLWV
jgi:uncharacterized phiE125 gp8 family phage protein